MGYRSEHFWFIQPHAKIRIMTSMRRCDKKLIALKWLLRTHSTFRKLMVWMGVFHDGVNWPDIHQCWSVINGVYYRDMLLTWELLRLPAVHEICAVFFIFQQCNAPAAAHRVRDDLEQQTPAFISSYLWPDLNRLDPLPQNMGRTAATGLPSSWCRWTAALINVWHGFEQCN